MKILKELIPAAIAFFYFFSIYFAVSALLPGLALQCGSVAMLFSLLAYRVLQITGNETEGLPVGLLMLLPISCIAAGIIWWILRLLGFRVVD